jgi:L-threonylcarbamoyladenylate synthase
VILQPTPENIAACTRRLLEGQLLGLPTETVYGLAADASNAGAVAQIYAVKGRPADHPLIVHVSSANAAQYWVEPSKMSAPMQVFATQLMQQFWPGPLTLIVPRAAGVAAYACAGQTTVGIRCPAAAPAQLVLQAFEHAGGKGVAAPSANRFGKVSPTQAAHVVADLGEQAPWVLDGGACEWGIESTIVDLSREQVRVLRPGSISAGQIAQVLGTNIGSSDAQAPKVSGSLASHYAPSTPVELVASGSLGFRTSGAAQTGDNIVVMAFKAKPESLRLYANLQWVQMPADSVQYATALYSQLRSADQLQAERLIIELPAQEPQWEAVHDRLQRSARSL